MPIAGMPDILTARTLNDEAKALDARAAEARARRDWVIRLHRTADPKRWTYTALSKATGLTPSQVSTIFRK